jgi:hypothetical protein
MATVLQLVKSKEVADGIPDIEVANMLAQAAAALNSEDVNAYLLSLVRACGPKHVQPCLQLVTAADRAQGRQERLFLVFTDALGLRPGGGLPVETSPKDVVALARALLSGIPGGHCQALQEEAQHAFYGPGTRNCFGHT